MNIKSIHERNRFFANEDTVIIPNQPTGGNIHNDDEWVDIETIKQFLEIKKDFLKNFTL